MRNDTWQPKPTDYFDALRDQNPWDKTGVVPEEFAKPSRRPLADALWKSMLQTPYRHQVVLGPRRVGKTVGLYQTIDNLIKNGIAPNRLWFLRLDHPLLMHYELGPWAKSLIRNYRGTPESPLFLFLDEVNYSKNWDKWLKTFFDERWPLRVVATSSSTAALRGRTVESGIGRWSEQFLTPYTFFEFQRLIKASVDAPSPDLDFFVTLRDAIESRAGVEPSTNDALRTFLLIGGFPELLTAYGSSDTESALLRSQQVLRSEAVQRVAGMDIPQVFDVKNPLILERLLYVLAGQMCGLMNVSNLSTQMELARQTVHTYIDYLEKAFLIFTLPNYSSNEEKIHRKGRKVYFVDGAVRNAALQRGVAPMNDSGEWGHLIENAAASHLHALSLQSGGRLFHWREGEVEVDLVYSESDNPIAFEVAKGSHSLSGLRAVQGRYPKLRNRCFLVSADSPLFSLPEENQDGIGRIPLTTFLFTVGRQMTASLAQRLGTGP